MTAFRGFGYAVAFEGAAVGLAYAVYVLVRWLS